ncbi:hypothetical protein FVEG_00601 [Fusarium verticillioides 7600]|uniref:Uncharacterized protein n=1 Tax=Gibberella moniliformis (strain M3125 / FGSC 7600) TaxID=334819 RepID=W7LVW0_GIBM7|nr:hypothetical protein FVEG_00601 [Fusarium verticillioides 7600]EWG36687.1 hypothetical protein FVEG_00601 [Fusarium verticillioides 7600]
MRILAWLDCRLNHLLVSGRGPVNSISVHPSLLHHSDARLQHQTNWIHDASEGTKSIDLNGSMQGKKVKGKKEPRYPLDLQLYAVPRLVGNTSPRVPRPLVKTQPCNFLSIAMATTRNL